MNNKNNTAWVKIIAIAAAILLLVALVHHCTKKSAPIIPPPTVVVQKPQWAETVEYVTQTGTTVAYQAVNLVARIEGYLDSIEFVDGSVVKKGQPLFVIQPQPYLEQLKAAQATVAAEKASLAYAKSEYARQQRMYRSNATSKNSVEVWLAKSDEAKAQVDKAIADEEIAAINYSYTHIAAPFDGRIGRHLVDIGNLVGNGVATNLATIEQIDPLYVYFNLNEIDLIKLRAAIREQGLTIKDIDKIPAYISLQNDTGFDYKAKLNFVNTGLNASTGTMELRALLENKEHVFVPGLFVQVRIPISKPQKRLTIPDTAILYDQIGPYALTVNQDNVVMLTRLTLGSTELGKRAVIKGLSEQDRVIVEGLQNASPGNKVVIQKG